MIFPRAGADDNETSIADSHAAALRHAAAGAYEHSIRALDEALELAPEDATTMNLLGVCNSLSLHFDAASEWYEAAMSADPSLQDTYVNAGWNALLSSPERAARYFREWLSRIPEPAPPPTGKRLALPSVTLCCVDCAYHALAARALRFTLSKCEFAAAIFFSARDCRLPGVRCLPLSPVTAAADPANAVLPGLPRDRDCRLPGVRWKPIPPVKSAAEYSNFMIHDLPRHIDTNFVLVVQYDGFVLDQDSWHADFLDYDYIGPKVPVGGSHVVGNGGF